MLKVYRYTLSGSLSFKENFIAEVVTSFVIDSINNLFFLQTSLMQVLNGIRSGPPVCCNILDWSQVSDVEDEELISSPLFTSHTANPSKISPTRMVPSTEVVRSTVRIRLTLPEK